MFTSYDREILQETMASMSFVAMPWFVSMSLCKSSMFACFSMCIPHQMLGWLLIRRLALVSSTMLRRAHLHCVHAKIATPFLKVASVPALDMVHRAPTGTINAARSFQKIYKPCCESCEISFCLKQLPMCGRR